jgi:hypothetical protein
MYRFKNALMAARAAATPRLCYRMIWIALLWPWTAIADERTLSLEDAVDQALQETPQVAASAATREAMQAVAPSAGHLPDPELVTGVDNLPVTKADRYSLTRDFMTMRKIGVLQSFPNSEKRRLQGELAQREIAVAQGDVRKTRFDTARAVAEAWIASAVAGESLVRLRTLKPDAQLEAAAGRAALASGIAPSAIANVRAGSAKREHWIGSIAGRLMPVEKVAPLRDQVLWTLARFHSPTPRLLDKAARLACCRELPGQ